MTFKLIISNNQTFYQGQKQEYVATDPIDLPIRENMCIVFVPEGAKSLFILSKGYIKPTIRDIAMNIVEACMTSEVKIQAKRKFAKGIEAHIQNLKLDISTLKIKGKVKVEGFNCVYNIACSETDNQLRFYSVLPLEDFSENISGDVGTDIIMFNGETAKQWIEKTMKPSSHGIISQGSSFALLPDKNEDGTQDAAVYFTMCSDLTFTFQKAFPINAIVFASPLKNPEKQDICSNVLEEANFGDIGMFPVIPRGETIPHLMNIKIFVSKCIELKLNMVGVYYLEILNGAFVEVEDSGSSEEDSDTEDNDVKIIRPHHSQLFLNNIFEKNDKASLLKSSILYSADKNFEITDLIPLNLREGGYLAICPQSKTERNNSMFKIYIVSISSDQPPKTFNEISFNLFDVCILPTTDIDVYERTNHGFSLDLLSIKLSSEMRSGKFILKNFRTAWMIDHTFDLIEIDWKSLVCYDAPVDGLRSYCAQLKIFASQSA